MITADRRLARIAELHREAASFRDQAAALTRQDSTPRPRSCDRDLAAEAEACHRQAGFSDRLAGAIQAEIEGERVDQLHLRVQLAAGALQAAHRVDDWTAGQAAIRAAHLAMSQAALDLHLYQRRQLLADPAWHGKAAGELREIFPASTTWPAVLDRLEAALADWPAACRRLEANLPTLGL